MKIAGRRKTPAMGAERRPFAFQGPTSTEESCLSLMTERRKMTPTQPSTAAPGDPAARPVAAIIRETGCEWGELRISVWDGQLLALQIKSGRRSTDAYREEPTIDDLMQRASVREAASALSRLYRSTRCVIQVRVAHGRSDHIDVHRVPEPADPETEAKRAQLDRLR